MNLTAKIIIIGTNIMWFSLYTVDDPGPGFMGMIMGFVVGFICVFTFFWIHDEVDDWKQERERREKFKERRNKILDKFTRD